MEVVGVVGDVRRVALERPLAPEFYLPAGQSGERSASLIARVAIEPGAAASSLRDAVQAIDPDLPIYGVTSLEELLAGSLRSRRFSVLLFGIFAAIALALAAAGIYGVMTHLVAQRTHEIGVRVALGARADGVVRMVVGQGMRPVAVGLASGAIGALAFTRVLRSLLFGVSASDPATIAGVAALLALVALIACFVPAQRAARIAATEALRHE
jgi:putative ABC transport system permease protein